MEKITEYCKFSVSYEKKIKFSCKNVPDKKTSTSKFEATYMKIVITTATNVVIWQTVKEWRIWKKTKNSTRV